MMIAEKMKQKVLSARVYESHRTFTDGTFASMSPRGKTPKLDNTRTSMALESIRTSFLSPDARKSTNLLSGEQTQRSAYNTGTTR